jgi:hypothetical protein
MNRRELTRWGLLSGLAPLHCIGAASQETVPSSGEPLQEPPPDHSTFEPPLSFREVIAAGRLSAEWSILEPHRVRLNLRNLTNHPTSVRFDQCIVLSDGRTTWLVGGPSRFEGAFGGQFAFGIETGELVAEGIPTLPGRVASIVLPAVRLLEDTTKSVGDIKAVAIETWTQDVGVRGALTGLVSLGTSLAVAQGIAWRSAEGKAWKEISARTVDGRILNEFEKNAVDRYLEVSTAAGAVGPDVLRNRLLDSRLSVVANLSPKYRNFESPLAAALVGRQFGGSRIAKVVSTNDPDSTEAPVRMELSIVEVSSVEPLRMTVEAILTIAFGDPKRRLRWARARVRFDGLESDETASSDDFVGRLAARFAEQTLRTERVSLGPSFSRFRLENLSPLVLAAVALRTDVDSAEPAVWPIDRIGISPRARCMLSVPADRAKPIDFRWSPI